MGKLKIIFSIALRNLFASKINLVIGGIVFFGTMLVVVGGALLDSVDHAMSRSVRGSVAGDVQVYSSKSADELALFGNMGGDPDLSPVTDFAKIEDALAKVPNVKSIVPEGISGALVTSGNTVDLTLADLREVVKAERTNDSPELKARRESLKAHVQQIVKVLKDDRKNLDAVKQRGSEDKEADETIDKAASPEFWAHFDTDPDAALEFLENKLAPQVADADLIFLRYVGTDLDEFQKSFDRMEIVDGAAVPPGQRGFLFSKRFYEDFLKLKSARRLDKIKEGIDDEHHTIADDATLQRYVKENKTQPRDIVLQLDPQKTQKAIALLQKDLNSKTDKLDGLLSELFDTTDQNFAERYHVFYSDLAPLLQLYRLRIGDTLTIKAFTKSGYVQSVNVKIDGTFEFKGLEKSSLAGALNLMDLMSFRQLYGYLTADKIAEIKRHSERSRGKRSEPRQRRGRTIRRRRKRKRRRTTNSRSPSDTRLDRRPRALAGPDPRAAPRRPRAPRLFEGGNGQRPRSERRHHAERPRQSGKVDEGHSSRRRRRAPRAESRFVASGERFDRPIRQHRQARLVFLGVRHLHRRHGHHE